MPTKKSFIICLFMKTMQAKLPDVNGAIVRHRNAAMIAYDQKDYSKAAISLNAINALLPDGYRVTINTQRYNDAIQSRTTITCRFCKTTVTQKSDDEDEETKTYEVPSTFELSTVKFYDLTLSSLDSLLSRQMKMRMWECPKCYEEQPLINSNIKTVKYEKPYFLGIIPELPGRKGLHDRVGHRFRFKQWYEIAFQELEKKVADYRRDYQAQNPDEDLSKYEEFLKD